MEHSRPKESKDGDEGDDNVEDHMFHGEVGLPAKRFAIGLSALEFASCESGCLYDDAPRLYDSYDSCHGYATYAYEARVVGKKRVGR